MSIASRKTNCIICNKCKITYICQGCSRDFCLDHLSEHRKNLGQQLEQIQTDHDQLRQNLNDYQIDPMKHLLIKTIDQWERDSINNIQQTAQRCRTEWIDYSNNFLLEMEKKLNQLAQQIQQIHQENEFSEIDLNLLKQKLQILQKELERPGNVVFKQCSTTSLNSISLLLPLGKGKTEVLTSDLH